MSVRRSLEAELAEMPEAVRSGTLAAAARVLAGVLDDGPGARDAASVAKEMRCALAELRALASAVPDESDPIDELQRRRDARVAGAPVPDRAAGGGQ